MAAKPAASRMPLIAEKRTEARSTGAAALLVLFAMILNIPCVRVRVNWRLDFRPERRVIGQLAGLQRGQPETVAAPAHEEESDDGQRHESEGDRRLCEHGQPAVAPLHITAPVDLELIERQTVG